MITIQAYNQSNRTTIMTDINKENSILLIGRGANERKLNEIYKPKNLWEMEEIFGDSELTEAYEDTIRAGANNVLVMNCYKTTDFIDSLEYIRHYNFAFVVPVGVNLSDTFYDQEVDREVFLAEHYLNEFSKFTGSLIIFSDAHASFYEDIDHYLSDMNAKVRSFKEQAYYLLSNHGRNIAFCLNNLENKKYANAILAALLSNAAPGTYPDNIPINAIFDFDSEDINELEIIYFKNNIHTDTSIENLKNFRTTLDANKLIAIDRVIKHIERTLDTSFVLGKLYNEYTKMTLHDYLDMFFRKLTKSAIKEYAIKDIQFVPGEDMSGHINVDIFIYPVNSLEGLDVLLEVK